MSRVFPSVLMVRESVSSVSDVSDNSSEKWLGSDRASVSSEKCKWLGSDRESVVNDPSSVNG